MNSLKKFKINHGQDTSEIEHYLESIADLLRYTSHGFVYALSHNGVTKIGFSKRPHGRLKELTVSQGVRNYEFLAFETFDAMRIERLAHANFHHKRIDKCEWFHLSHESACKFLSSTIINIPEDIESIIEASKDRAKQCVLAFMDMTRILMQKRYVPTVINYEASHKDIADDQGFCIYKKEDGSVWLYTCDQDMHQYNSINDAISEMVNDDFINNVQTFNDVECYFYGFDKEELAMLFNLEIIRFIKNKVDESSSDGTSIGYIDMITRYAIIGMQACHTPLTANMI